MNHNVILLGANNPRAVGEVVENLLAAGNAVEVTSEVVAETLLVKIEFENAAAKAAKKAAREAWDKVLKP